MEDKQIPNGTLAEYASLRTEILESDKTCLQIMAMTVAVFGVVVGYGISAERAHLLLVPLPLLWAAYQYIAEKRWVIYKISSYIRSQLEPRTTGMGWEAAIGRARGRAAYRLPYSNLLLVELLLIILAGSTCLYLFDGFAELSRTDWRWWLPLALWGAMTAHSVWIYMHLRRVGGTAAVIDTLWSE